jgi:transaldolase
VKLFIDTANIEEIRRATEWGLIDGVTTNPTLAAREGREFKPLVEEICGIVDGPISVEAVSTVAEEIVPEAEALAGWHKNIAVKIPITAEGLKATNQLAGQGVRVNMTLIFSPLQALLAAKAGARYVSPFVGRLDDISHVGMDIVGDIRSMFDNYPFETEIIVASIRNPLHVLDAALMGADIATVPFRVLEQLIHHPLTDRGIERFLADWKKLAP